MNVEGMIKRVATDDPFFVCEISDHGNWNTCEWLSESKVVLDVRGEGASIGGSYAVDRTSSTTKNSIRKAQVENQGPDARNTMHKPAS
jgi:hypothetical protein